jgi:hypothetical protein
VIARASPLPRAELGGARDELVEGCLVVAEAGAEAGLLLWRALRDVRAWAAAPAPLRPFVFPPSAGPERRRRLGAASVDEPLQAPLCVFARLVEALDPADGLRVLHACRRVAGWAAERDLPVTRAAFEACAARLRPDAAHPPH